MKFGKEQISKAVSYLVVFVGTGFLLYQWTEENDYSAIITYLTFMAAFLLSLTLSYIVAKLIKINRGKKLDRMIKHLTIFFNILLVFTIRLEKIYWLFYLVFLGFFFLYFMLTHLWFWWMDRYKKES